MSEPLPALEEARGVNAGFPFTEPMRRWKDQGGKIVGWGCTYIPEEIITAAGLMAVRVKGDARETQTDDADAYLYVNACSYVRTVLQLALDGEYDFLDGYVNTSSCDATRRLVDMWRYYVPKIPIVHMITLPRKNTAAAEDLYLEQLDIYKSRLEELFDTKVTDEQLRRAIHIHNRTRELLRAVSELRKEAVPLLSGAENFELTHAGLRMPREAYNDLLDRLLADAKARKVERAPRVRLMLAGSNLANPDFVAGIEAEGADVVIEDVCTGIRYWSDLVDEGAAIDPMRALAHRYLNNIPCARTVGLGDLRHDRLLALAKEYRVDGLIIAIIRNCSPNSLDRPLLRQKFEEAGIHVLELDTEYGSGRTGQVATRVQAFLEMLHALAPA